MPQRLLKRPVLFEGVYVIPRTDGTALIGESDRDAGFDQSVDPASVERLLQVAVRAMPVLSELTIAQSWTALRPRSPNLRPFIGKTALDGYYIAAGHYRHGILLAPTTALAVANVIEGSVV
jgi:glycine/D-amino acid oxidase-like deaminating enzyme